MSEPKPTQIDDTLNRIAQHVEERQHYGSFNKEKSGPVLNINDDKALLQHIKDTINDPDTRGFAATDDGRKMYFYNEKTNTAIIIDPNAPSGGSAYRPKTPSQGARWFQKQFDASGRILGKMPEVVEGGMKVVSEVLEKNGSTMAKLADLFGDVAKGAGKTLKILGPLGVAGSLYEAQDLIGKASAAVDYGALDPNALIEYDVMMAAHVAQATVDPTMVGGEAAVQVAFDAWGEKWNVPEYLKESLEPSSLIEVLFGEITAQRELEQNNFFDSLPAEVQVAGMPVIAPELDAMIVQKHIITSLEGNISPSSDPVLTAQLDDARDIFDELYNNALENNTIDFYKDLVLSNNTTEVAMPVLHEAPSVVDFSSKQQSHPALGS